jgi:hypothetical protein
MTASWISFVSSFVFYDPSLNVLCADEQNRRYYCIPRHYKPRPSRLFRNKGDGTFSDVSTETGIGSYPGKSFGAVATDVNNDGWLDLFVATTRSRIFSSSTRRAKSSRRLAWQPELLLARREERVREWVSTPQIYDGDGWQDLFVANIDYEFFSLYPQRERHYVHG